VWELSVWIGFGLGLRRVGFDDLGMAQILSPESSHQTAGSARPISDHAIHDTDANLNDEFQTCVLDSQAAQAGCRRSREEIN